MAGRREITSYRHRGEERVNNPPVGLVTGATDPDAGQRTYEYDPHLDPQLVWAGKAEHTSFEVPTVSLHEHERIDPRSIIKAVRRNGEAVRQPSFFEAPEENLPMRQALQFYQHRRGWTNRLVAGDSLLVMNSLLEKEGLGGQVQMIYIDPPYGIRYGSNFQPFVNKRDVHDGRDDDLTREPETIRAFRDTWELGIHSYLSYLRDRLLLAKELLHESGSLFLQIGDENVHLARSLTDEVLGVENFIGQIVFAKTSGYATNYLTGVCDYILWYGRDRKLTKYRQLYSKKQLGGAGASKYNRLRLVDGTTRSLTSSERSGSEALPPGARPWTDDNLTSQGNPLISYEYNSKRYSGTYKTTEGGLKRLALANRLYEAKSSLRFIRYFDDFPVVVHNIAWMDIGGVQSRTDPKVYVVQTANEAVKRCVLMSTDPGDLVFDPTCGSGTTAYVAEQWGRRWITCDTSRVSITLARQRLMTAAYDYYQLAHPDEGVGSGFRHRTVPHVSLRSIANNPDIREGMSQAQIDAAIARHAPQETLYDEPLVNKSKARVTGPFTVEAVPAPVVRSLSEVSETGDPDSSCSPSTNGFDASTARSGETLRQSDWRDELLETGIRGRAGQRIAFGRLEPQAGTRWLHAVGETHPHASDVNGTDEAPIADAPQSVAVSFGPDHAPLEQRQVEEAWHEALALNPRPDLLVFAAFQFDPEAAKDIDEMNPALAGVQFLKAQMNADLLTDDLRRNRSSNESFWLIGQPDVEVRKLAEGEDAGKWQVEVHGFDYFNTRTGGVESGGSDHIAVWMLDPDYDGRSLFPEQVFFPMAGARDGWARLARNLKAEIDTDLIETYRGTVSLPFEAGDHGRAAVKIVDDRGIESLRVVQVA